MDALRPPLFFADFDVVDFLLFVEAFDLLDALPRFAVVDFLELDFFAPPPPPPPPPLFFFIPLLLDPARFFVPADFAMKPPSGGLGVTQ
jgi:hypothetical protein